MTRQPTFAVLHVPPVFCLLLTAVPATVAVADERVEFFEKKIRPVLVEHCYECHAVGAKKIRGGLLLDSRETSRTGGDSGPAVVPGKPDESLLLSALRHDAFEMPPDRKLPTTVIRDFESWIRNGAVDPREGVVARTENKMDLLQDRSFWSFQPIHAPVIPTVESEWPETPVDRFLAAHHAALNVKVAGDASADQVLRRLHFALIGLPPRPEDIRQFRGAWAQNDFQAITDLADQLMLSPRFGERWGRHWLDVARFAESSGGGRSLMFPNAWRFRDYVIQSFNDDKPFDVFIREQIAGDLLPYESADQFNEQACGSAYLALGPTNYELQDKELLRMEVIDEQIDTIGRTFLGLTIGCARCHDHKFDPIPTSEYYALAGIFRSTQSLVPGNVSSHVKTPLRSDTHARAFSAWQKRSKDLNAEINELKQRTGLAELPKKGGVDPTTLPGIVIDDANAVFEGQWTSSSSLQPYVGSGYRHDNNDKSGKRAQFEARVPRSGEYDVGLAHNYQSGRCQGVAVSVKHADGTTQVFVDQRRAPADKLFSPLGRYRFDTDSVAVVTIDAEQSKNGHIIVDAVQFLDVAKSPAQITDDERTGLLARLSELQKELGEHNETKPEPLVTMSVVDQDQPADWHIHIRGGVRNLGPEVARGFLSVASPLTDHAGLALPVEIPEAASGRRELADWIASPDNPLTARVYVNRVWQHLIGEGLVRTPDNFGKMGTRPTNPELLDFLASTFITEDRWSTKSLIRRIVTSRVFRLASDVSSADDPENGNLTRAFRRQLDAEALRDSLLQISGQLDLNTIGGRTISKVTQYDGTYDHSTGSTNLRSVYVPYLRNAMLEPLSIFDTANPNVVTGRRTQTVLPGQALYLMNSPFVRDQANHAATVFLARQADDDRDTISMIEDAWLLVLGRAPTESEVRTMTPLLESAASGQPAWTDVFQTLFGSIDFRFVE